MALGSSKFYKEAYDRATALCSDKDYHAAIAQFEVAIDIEPYNPMAYYGLGLLYLQIGDWDSSIEYSNLAIARNKALYEAYMNLGHAYSKKAVKTDDDDNWESAAKAHGKAVGLKPNSALALHALGFDLWKLGDFPEAVKNLEKVIDIDPENRGARGLLSKIYLSHGQFEIAWRVYWGLPRKAAAKHL